MPDDLDFRKENGTNAAEAPQTEGAPKETPKFVVNISDEEFTSIPVGDATGTDGRKPAKKKRGWLRVLITVGAILFVCGYMAYYALTGINDLTGMGKYDSAADVDIPQNPSIYAVAKLLGRAQVIDRPLVFTVYAKMRGYTAKFTEGTFPLNSNMSYDQILSVLYAPVDNSQVVRLTFPEGITAAEIAATLEKAGVCSAADFLQVLSGSVDYGYEFEQMMPQNGLRLFKYEGYLFPDTYDFFIGEKPESVAKKFLANFNSKVTSDLYDKMRDMGFTLDQALTLGSIIQKEASGTDSMATVSSVFHNRLNKPSAFPSLQSDVTVFYVNNTIKPALQKTNQEMYDAYNTYKCTGLPVGPICNPGIDAIKAALYPANTNYYYFVTDSLGKYYYATTFDQHEVNIAKAKAASANVHGTDAGN